MRIGVLTGGSDAPGLNAAIRAIVLAGDAFGHKVMGIHHGWKGMIDGRMELMANRDVYGTINKGGTILSTSRFKPLSEENSIEKLLIAAERARLDALIGIGGLETMQVLYELSKKNFQVIGIPKTIDNDVGETESCIGFDSAVEVICKALDTLHTTAASHDRVMIVEVMGGGAGWLALFGGMAGAADWIMIPEFSSSVRELDEHLQERRQKNKNFSLIVIAESSVITDLPKVEEGSVEYQSIGFRLKGFLEKNYNWETRCVVLGHLQRGGSPTVFDRNLATRLGVKAVQLLREGTDGVMMGFKCSEPEPVKLEKVIKSSPKLVTRDLYDISRIFNL